jgi:CMP-N-acetylneuraminic acid synthetase
LKIGIIPARGGSKGIKGKNLQKVGGRTLIERAISSAIGSNLDIVIVSTDSDEIGKVSEQAGAIVHHRSKMNSTDSASSEAVLLEVIEDYGKGWGEDATLCFIQATSPFIDPVTVDKCLALAGEGFVGFSARKSHFNLWRLSSETWIPVNHPSNSRIRRQDAPIEVIETGAVYAFKLHDFINAKYRFCAEAKPVYVDPFYDVEIDAIEDLYIANLLAEGKDL